MSDEPKILGVNKRWYPDLRNRGSIEGGVYLLTVLVAGAVGDYAAYQGIGEDAVAVARYGDKISFTEATVHFPRGQLQEERYRT